MRRAGTDQGSSTAEYAIVCVFIAGVSLATIAMVLTTRITVGVEQISTTYSTPTPTPVEP